MMRIHTKAFAISCGIVCGLCLCALTICGFFLGFGEGLLKLLISLLPGFNISPLGSIIGLGYGFAIGCFLGGLKATLYNRIYVRM